MDLLSLYNIPVNSTNFLKNLIFPKIGIERVYLLYRKLCPDQFAGGRIYFSFHLRILLDLLLKINY